jgi:hypothetical protein
LFQRKEIRGEELRTLIRLADGASPESEVARKRAVVETVSKRPRRARADYARSGGS